MIATKSKINRAATAMSEFFPALTSGVQLEFFARNDISSSQIIILMGIYYFGRRTMGQLASSMNVSMPTVTGLIDRLVKLGLVGRFHDEDDRRKVFARLKPKGQKLVAEFKDIVMHRWQNVLMSLNDKQLEQFYSIVNNLSSNIKSKRSGLA